MGALSDALNSPEPVNPRPSSHPAGWEPGTRYEPREVVVCSTREPGSEEQGWREEIQRHLKITIPADQAVELVDVRFWGAPDAPSIYARYKIGGSAQAPLPLEELVYAARKRAKSIEKRQRSAGRTLIVAWADLQVGKTGSRGGTEQLIERVTTRLEALARHAKQQKCSEVYLIDVGDCVESFENTSEQGFTNDLSFPEQLRVARRLFTEAVLTLAPLHDRVVCAAVPSNHGRWRRGKGNLGRPGDDFGIETLTSVADALKLAGDKYGHVSFYVPSIWEESVAFAIQGRVLGVAHGHQAANPDRIAPWWAHQVHGGQPVAAADILLTGHFHSFRMQVTGRSSDGSRSKWSIQAPTLDSGSDWYRHRYGSDSDPGLLVFSIDEGGWRDLVLL